ncbi:hypothetical protein [Thalassotalea castellviae]|uniref:Uncharacterized protein n=1 Tax=Thalassotalea castellviae TaxID=3075612 RepID=A0ABU3A5T4_9GAMM|nr:hypothetical protein [Thalassotalea sp. W431]MDT0604907.1 hypothetical protein [Thalassotalea sp. W431]
MARLTIIFIFIPLLLILQTGCTVVTATVGVASVVVGGAIEVVDTVTPDIIDDDEEEDEDEDEQNNIDL